MPERISTQDKNFGVVDILLSPELTKHRFSPIIALNPGTWKVLIFGGTIAK
jgi:hypothetical protein